jgi:hypothetical protein
MDTLDEESWFGTDRGPGHRVFRLPGEKMQLLKIDISVVGEVHRGSNEQVSNPVVHKLTTRL